MIFRRLLTGQGSGGTISSFDVVTLRLSGMRGSTEYEIVPQDGKAEVSQYGIRYTQREDQRVLERRTLCDTEEVLSLLNDCRLLSWDGFDGPHPKWVLDGTMFTLEAVVNGDQRISAHGSENFPKHYREFRDGLYQILERKTTMETRTKSKGRQ